MIHRTCSHCHIQTIHSMWYVYIFNIFSYIASFYMIILKIRHSHYNNICIKLHHQCYKFLFTYIICFNTAIFFCLLKDRIIRITCYVMYYYVGILKNIFNHSGIVFVKSIIFRIEYKMLINNREKSLIISFLPLCIWIFFKELLLARISTYAFKCCKLFLTLLKVFIINVFLRINCPVKKI